MVEGAAADAAPSGAVWWFRNMGPSAHSSFQAGAMTPGCEPVSCGDSKETVESSLSAAAPSPRGRGGEGVAYVEDVDGVQQGGGPTSGCSDALVPPVITGCKPESQADLEREVVVASAAADPGTGGAWRGAYVAQTDGSDALVPPVPSGCKPDARAGVEREVVTDASAATAAGNAKT